jgi:outer membrane protein assembly factor BamB
MFNHSKRNVNVVLLLLIVVFNLIVANATKSQNDGYLWESPVTSHKVYAPALWSLSDIYIEDNWHQPLISANNNKLIVLGSNNISQTESVLTFDGKTGKPTWSAKHSGSTITTTESKVIVGGESRVVALDIRNGSTLWSTGVLSNVVDIIPKGNNLYVYGVSVHKYVLDVSNGIVLEKFEAPYSIEEEPSIGDIAYTFDGNGNIIATDKPNNQVLWRIKANAISNLAVTHTFIYALGDDGSLLRFDTQTGKKESWLLFAPASFVASSKQTTSFAYYVAIDTSTNILFVYLGDSAQLFAFQMPIA